VIFRALFFVVLTFSSFAFAGADFENLREDATVPENCKQLDLNDFQGPHEIITYGISGAKAVGFTHEYPLSREDANILWVALKNAGSEKFRVETKLASDAELKRNYDLIEANLDMGFDFGSEGEVLEALALIDLRKTYPESEYFHTGGVEYSHGGSAALGELDVIVGRRSDCHIVVVGEAKLGVSQLYHAQSQMARFDHFIHHP
jgi:hypothetical protein